MEYLKSYRCSEFCMKSIHFDMVHIPIHRFVWQHLYRIEKVGFISFLSDEIGFVSSPSNEISLLTLSIEWRIYLHLLEYYLLPVFWISSFLSSINISISYPVLYQLHLGTNRWYLRFDIVERNLIIRVFKELEIFTLLYDPLHTAITFVQNILWVNIKYIFADINVSWKKINKW